MLTYKVVMITGVGRGLGRALAEAFLDQGCSVVGIARSQASLQELSAIDTTGQFLCRAADVARYDQVESVVNEAKSRFGKIDVLFNNAAIYPKVNFLEESALDWSRAIDVNVNGIANCCKAVLPLMIETGAGRIFNIGSFADLNPIENSAAYSASKGAVRALTKAIASDLQHVDADIEVHEWIPGHLNTRMSGFTGSAPSTAAGWAVQLAGMPKARTRNCIFVNDQELRPPRGLRRRLIEKVLFWQTFK